MHSKLDYAPPLHAYNATDHAQLLSISAKHQPIHSLLHTALLQSQQRFMLPSNSLTTEPTNTTLQSDTYTQTYIRHIMKLVKHTLTFSAPCMREVSLLYSHSTPPAYSSDILNLQLQQHLPKLQSIYLTCIFTTLTATLYAR
jgi:hypothetical protein